MRYPEHYDRLIQRARERVLVGYGENHHVVPRCLDGSDDPSNIVRLTAEEHYVAHQLLHKIHPHNRGLAYAMTAMCMAGRNKAYGWVRRAYAEAQRGRVKSDQERANIAAAGRERAPRVFSEQARRNMAAGQKKKWDAWRENGTEKDVAIKVRERRIENGTYNFTPEHRAAIGAAGRGRVPWNKGIINA